MHLAIYAHPFDLSALASHGGLARLRDLGFAEVALATSYHDGRWLTPWHPERRVRFLEDGAVHFRPDPEGAGYGELRPLPSSEVPATEPSPLASLCAAAPAQNLAVRAWTVFGHDTRLGLLHPDVTVQNAFGDRQPYALCPSQPAVQHFHRALTADVARHPGLGAIEFEALGQMGFNHSSHHEKKSFTPKGLLEFALSTCCCPACERLGEQLGHDYAAVRAGARREIDRGVRDADAMQPEPSPGPAALDATQRAWVEAVLAVRARAVAALVESIVPATAALQVRRAVQVHPDPWFTGSQLAAAASVSFPATDERVLTCYGMGPDAIGRLLTHDGLRALGPAPRRLCIWPKAPEFTGDEDLVKVRGLCDAHGIASVAVYHLGLLPWRTVERVAKMFA